MPTTDPHSADLDPLPAGTSLSTRDGAAVVVADQHAAAAASESKSGLWAATMELFDKFVEDDGMTQAAALAFYTGLALAPLLTVVVWIATLVLDQQATARVMQVATNVLGSQAAAPIKDLLIPASQQARAGMTLTGLLSIAFLFFTASSVLAQLQASLNLIWRVKPDPKISGIVTMIRKRIFSFGMLFTVLFLLLVSMMVSVGIEAVFGGKEEAQAVSRAEEAMHAPDAQMPTTRPIDAGPPGSAASIAAATRMATVQATTRVATTRMAAATQAAERVVAARWLLRVINLGVSFVVATGVFVAIFTYLPDARVPWRDTIFGAALTAVLFLIGRYAMGLYLGRGSYETSYGAAVGSFVALLVWVYYTSIIIFVGTEATQVYARRHGHVPVPEKYAVKTERIEQTITPANN